MERSKRPRPTTVKPITEPALNATRRPLFRLCEAALAVRQLAMVAVRMPMKPESPEKKPPVRKATGVKKLSSPAKAMAISTTNTTAKNTPTPIYWRLRYALAPLLTAFDIFSISGVPAGCFFTRVNMTAANPRATRLPSAAKSIESIFLSLLSLTRRGPAAALLL